MNQNTVFEKMNSLHNSTILIAGLARNCEENLAGSVARLSKAFESSRRLEWLIIESDSSDGTLDVLYRLASKKNNFHYVSLGCLREQYPKRTERVAFCRNHYLDQINGCIDYQDVDYVVIADLDGVNSNLSSDAVSSCWARTDWDVCTANQDGPYYDIWALRHRLWSPNDCWKQADFLMRNGVGRFKSIFASVYSRMVRLDPYQEWVEVDSAFGGLAVYRKAALKDVTYVGLTPNCEEICEHVSLNHEIRKHGGRIFINPKLLNSGAIEHTKYATGIGLIRFWLRCRLLDIADYLRIFHYLEQARMTLRGFLR